MDEILYTESGRLWVGRLHEIRVESTQRFDRVVSVCQDTAYDNVGCPYDHFDLADGEDTNERYGGSYDYESFREAMSHVERLLRDGESIALHCHAGQSRSVSVAMGALGRILDLRPDEAFGQVKEYRTQAQPDQLLYEHASRYIDERHA